MKRDRLRTYGIGIVYHANGGKCAQRVISALEHAVLYSAVSGEEEDYSIVSNGLLHINIACIIEHIMQDGPRMAELC